MKYKTLGNTDLKVSLIALGTMTFGEQNTEAEAHEQLDYALERGVNFIDAAEMYPVPPKETTYGDTERIIGTWLQKRQCRDKIVLASKVAGPFWRAAYIRGGGARFDRKNIEAAIDESLKRLKTDYLDLYQLHWPDRNTNFFGKLGYVHQEDEQQTPIVETLEVLQDIQKTGKVRHFGVSNETPWGLMQFLKISENKGTPRMMSIQNPYSLLNRSFEVGLAEVAHREQVGLLAYSPLGFGVLSGKYLSGKHPEGARLTVFSGFERYRTQNAERAVRAYVELAEEYELSPAQMALAYVNTRPFLTSNIIGATKLTQLKENIDSIDVILPEKVLERIERIHVRYSNPCP